MENDLCVGYGICSRIYLSLAHYRSTNYVENTKMIIPPSKQDAAHIQQSYADVVETFKDQPANKKTLSKIQDALNDNARRIYDKWGRIIAKVGPNDYIDITSPRAKLNEGTVRVEFMEVNREGKPIGNI